MAVDCNGILKLAIDGMVDADCETKFRNFIGRAYYASYHRAKEFHENLPDQGLHHTEQVGAHRRLSFALENPTVSDRDLHKKSKQLGYICRDLHAKRVDADYHIDIDIGKKMAEQAIAQAQFIFKLT